MKKKLLLIIITLMLGGISYFGYEAIQKQTIKQQVEKTIQELPDFSFYTLSEDTLTYGNSAKKSTLIIYFHPECEHCQYEAKQLLLHKEQFSATQIMMVSPAPLADIQQFKSDYQLNDIEPLQVLWDKDRKFEAYFGVATFPTVLIYNTENKLQKKYKGEVKIEAILKHIEKEESKKVTNEISSTVSSTHHFTDFNVLVALLNLGL